MLKRIKNKARSVIDALIGKVHLSFEKRKWLKPIPFKLYKSVGNAVQVKHQYPVNFSKNDAPLFAHYTNYESGGEEVFELENVKVSAKGVVFKSINNFGPALPHPVFRNTYGWLYILGQAFFCKEKKARDDKTYILIYDFWSAGNYYHWLIDTLPRLWIVREELKQDAYSLILPANCPKFIKASLTYFEIKNITYIAEKEYLAAKKLLVPNYSAGSGHIHPGKILEIKDYFTNTINAVSSKGKIYVSRGKQKARRIKNEQEIIACVLEQGFEIVYFEDHTFEEQVSIGKNAKVMITSHGANLTNCMFMQSGTSVLELIRKDRPNFCYWALCNAVNVNYHYQLCEVAGNDHLLADVELFKVNLQKILKNG